MHLEKYSEGNLTLSVSGFLLNTIMLVKLSKQKNKKPAQVFLINLCVADEFICLFAFISGLSPHLYGTLMDPQHNSTLFKVFTNGIMFSFSASLPSCWTITFDRLFAIIRPLRHATYYTKTKLKLHIMIIWVYAVIITTISIIGSIIMSSMIVMRYILAPSLFVTIILLITAYTLIIKSILKNNMKMAGIAHIHQSAKRNSRVQRNKRIYIHSLVIILNFTLCSSPYVIFSILHSPMEHNEQPLFMAIVTMGLTAIPLIDSLSYFFLNLLIRRKRQDDSIPMREITIK